MRHFIIILFLIFTPNIAFGDVPQCYVAENAGSGDANQEYNYDRDDGSGRPIYVGDTNSDIELSYGVHFGTFQPAWTIQDTSFGDQLYAKESGGQTSQPVEGTYDAVLGGPPGADVSECGGGGEESFNTQIINLY